MTTGSGLLRRSGTLLTVLGSVAWLVAVFGWFRGVGRVRVLREAAATLDPVEDYPSVSVVVAARDEEAGIGEALQSLLTQAYPGRLEVIVVNDRSTDGTASIVARLAARRPERLRPLRIDRLPEGWLGKNHALYRGAQEATGEWMLFTDADVRFAPGAIGDAVHYALSADLDHLTLSPDLISHGVALRSFVATFIVVFGVTQRPWLARDPYAREAVGVGAFNLVRREAYRGAGTHAAIRLRPDDDMRLARLLKESGYSQDVAYGAGSVSVEWHTNLAGAVRGLEKSIFPGLDYRLSLALLGSLLLCATNIVPFAGVLFARRPAMRFLFAADVLSVVAVYAYGPRVSGSELSPLYAVLHPFGAGVFVYATLRSACLALARGGIEWRGTFYPLRRLRGDAR